MPDECFQEETMATPDTTTTDARDADDTPAGAEQAREAGTATAEETRERTADEYEAEIRRLRREAAKRRVEINELRPLAEKAQQVEDAQKTEAEKAAERIAALEAENQNLHLAQARQAAAAEHDVPADLLHGTSAEDITAHAEALAKWVGKKIDAAVAEAVPHAPSVPGENAGTNGVGDTDWLRTAMTRNH